MEKSCFMCKSNTGDSCKRGNTTCYSKNMACKQFVKKLEFKNNQLKECLNDTK